MNTKKWLYILGFSALVVALGSCSRRRPTDQPPLEVPAEPDATIGSLAEVYEFGAIPVRGWGIAAGLAGTGSSECDATLRSVLVKYIQQQVPEKATIDADEFINSKDTAVVEINGVIPPLASRGHRFDLEVTALAGTQTTSLAGGRLFSSQLKAASRLQRFDQYSKTLATAQGPVFIDKLGDAPAGKIGGYVLGGGVTTNNTRISLFLFSPGFRTANAIQNRLNERFGPRTANAVSPSEIRLTVPQRLTEHKDKFLAMVKLLYLAEDEQSQQRRIEMLAARLGRGEDIVAAETALTVIGKAASHKLAGLLNAADEKIRFHAARSMLDIGDDRALPVLRRIIEDNRSGYRIEAIKAVGTSAKRNDAIPILNSVLAENNFDVRFAAYEQLRRLDDISVSRMLIARDFFVDSVVCAGQKTIFVSRTGTPRIVLFGAPIYCEQNIFIESPDREIIINSAPGEDLVSVIRKDPARPKLIGPLKSSFKLADVIRTMGEAIPVEGKPSLYPGLGISYSDVIAILKLMCNNNAVKAEFRAGPMPAQG
jgi:hypothetical protein